MAVHTYYIKLFTYNQKEKEDLFSVQGFEMETSNFTLNGCPRVSKNQKFQGSDWYLLHWKYYFLLQKTCFLTSLFTNFMQNFTHLSKFFAKKTYFATTVCQSESPIQSNFKFCLIWDPWTAISFEIGGLKTFFNFHFDFLYFQCFILCQIIGIVKGLTTYPHFSTIPLSFSSLRQECLKSFHSNST